jgi:hypothetical protein
MLTTGKIYIEYRHRCTLRYMHVTKYALVNKRKIFGSLAAMGARRSPARSSQTFDVSIFLRINFSRSQGSSVW